MLLHLMGTAVQHVVCKALAYEQMKLWFAT